jgi:hypothetical protein
MSCISSSTSSIVLLVSSVAALVDLAVNSNMLGICIDGDHLERYALNRIPPGPLLDSIEEHLILCSDCQQQLHREDEAALLIRAAHPSHCSGVI